MSDESLTAVGLRDLSRNTREVLAKVEDGGESLLVTRQGRIVAALVPVDESRIRQMALASLPRVTEAIQRSDTAVEEGTSMSADEIEAQLGLPSLDRPEPVMAFTQESSDTASLTGLIDELSRELVALPAFSPSLAGELRADLTPERVSHVRLLNHYIVATTFMEAAATARERVRALNEVTLSGGEGRLEYLGLVGDAIASIAADPDTSFTVVDRLTLGDDV